MVTPIQGSVLRTNLQKEWIWLAVASPSPRTGRLGDPIHAILMTLLDSKKLEHGCRMMYAGVPSFFGLGLEDGPVPTFWPLLQKTRNAELLTHQASPRAEQLRTRVEANRNECLKTACCEQKSHRGLASASGLGFRCFPPFMCFTATAS